MSHYLTGLRSVTGRMYPFVDPIEPCLRVLFKPLANCWTAGCHLDVYTGGSGTAPVVIFIHGGAFTQGSSRDIPFNQVAWFVERGVVCVSVEYRLAPHAHFSDIREDLRDAYRYIQKDLQGELDGAGLEVIIDPTRCAIAGSSAGGTSSLIMATEALALHRNNASISSPIAVMPAYPLVFNEGPSENCRPRSAMKEMFENKPEWGVIQRIFNEPVCVSDPYPEDVFKPDMTKPRIAFVQAGFASKSLNSFIVGRDAPFGEESNFLDRLKSDFPPTLVLCAMKDGLIPVRHSISLVKHLESLGVEVKRVEVEADHGFVDLPATVFPELSTAWWSDSVKPSLEWLAAKLGL